jgi:hypothetical protein
MDTDKSGEKRDTNFTNWHEFFNHRADDRHQTQMGADKNGDAGCWVHSTFNEGLRFCRAGGKPHGHGEKGEKNETRISLIGTNFFNHRGACAALPSSWNYDGTSPSAWDSRLCCASARQVQHRCPSAIFRNNRNANCSTSSPQDRPSARRMWR